jgi:DNA transformation protein
MDKADIEEMFAGLGEVSVKRMFGGQGVYHGGLIVAVVFEGEMLLKADDETHGLFEAAGARRWTYEGQAGKSTAMPYWSIPDEAYDDPDQMAIWTRRAYEAALRRPAKPVKKARKA